MNTVPPSGAIVVPVTAMAGVDRARAATYVGPMTQAEADPVLAALDARGTTIRRVRYRANRSVLLSVSRDGLTLNSHECFRVAPGPVARAIAEFVAAPRGSAASRRALAAIRSWPGVVEGVARARRVRPRRRVVSRGAEPEVLRGLYDRLNVERFQGRLPPVPLRTSRRMRRMLGCIAYTVAPGVRGVREIALNAELLVPGKERVLEDTLLHEMAHAEAWLCHGHRGHGRIWRRIALRVGCEPRALTRAAPPGRGRNLGGRRP
jgi:hypothetical protein